MLQIAVCDDDRTMGEYLKQLIEGRLTEEKDCRVVLFTSGERLLNEDKYFDIYFLDIDLKDMSGLDMARTLRCKTDAVLVFVTALKEYVFDAFDVKAFQYLLKPIDEERFIHVLDQALAECRGRTQTQPLVIKANGVHRNIQREQILYVENEGRKVVLCLKDEKISYYAKMGELEEILGKGFYRCHRGYLVNLQAVKSYDTGTIQLKNGETILMAKQKYNTFVSAYMDFLRRK